MDSDEEKEGRDELFRFKKRLTSCLKTESLEAVLAEVKRLPPRHAVSPLIAGLFDTDSNIKWHAVSALGAVVAVLAERRPRKAGFP
jgi:hypothetical protein